MKTYEVYWRDWDDKPHSFQLKASSKEDAMDRVRNTFLNIRQITNDVKR
jgi:1,2-phenylacetyl-CoA epoxidase PaaB subunit